MKDRVEYDHQRYLKRYPLERSTIMERSRAYRLRIKIEVLSHYSQGILACSICAEDRLVCLSIDHIDGGGTRQRRELNITGSHNFYQWLRKQKYPEGYQVLCMNCQFVKRFHYSERDDRNSDGDP